MQALNFSTFLVETAGTPSSSPAAVYRMTGLDLSEELIAEARSATPLGVRWVRDDMRSLCWAGEVETRSATSYIFTAGELCRMHAAAGLRPVKLLGSTNEEPYQIGSPRLILISAKNV